MQTILKSMVGILMLALVFGGSFALAGDEELWGTYKLISAVSHYLDNDETVHAYGTHPNGYINYSKDGRMMVLVAYDGRLKLDKPQESTPDQRDSLYNSFFSYGGTYTYTGNQITHHIDVSWNESWTGRDVIRDITRDGDRLTYVTKPQTNPRNGRPVVVTLVWEKVK